MRSEGSGRGERGSQGQEQKGDKDERGVQG